MRKGRGKNRSREEQKRRRRGEKIGKNRSEESGI
jgi:hypothetical protein